MPYESFFFFFFQEKYSPKCKQRDIYIYTSNKDELGKK